MTKAPFSCYSGLFCCLILAAMFLFEHSNAATANRDFYKILEIKKNAKDDEIKKSYRKLTLQYHPDKNPGDDEAKKKFHDVADAYEVLKDSDKRRKYDRCDEECVNKEEQSGGMNPFGGIFGNIFG